MLQVDDCYYKASDSREAMKFLGLLNKLEQQRHVDRETEILMRAAKSRPKSHDQMELKQKAKQVLVSR